MDPVLAFSLENHVMNLILLISSPKYIVLFSWSYFLSIIIRTLEPMCCINTKDIWIISCLSTFSILVIFD